MGDLSLRLSLASERRLLTMLVGQRQSTRDGQILPLNDNSGRKAAYCYSNHLLAHESLQDIVVLSAAAPFDFPTVNTWSTISAISHLSDCNTTITTVSHPHHDARHSPLGPQPHIHCHRLPGPT